MEWSPVRNLAPDFDFSIEPDTPAQKTPPTIKRLPAPVNTHDYAYSSEKWVFMAHYKTANGKIISVEYKPLKLQLDK